MNDNRKLVIRKAADGINHEAVIMDYCGRWYEKSIGRGYNKRDALDDLINRLETEVYIARNDLEFAKYANITEQ